MFGFSSKDIITLDLTSRSISATVLRRKPQGSYEAVCSFEKEHQGYGDGEFFDADDTAKIAKEVLDAVIKNSSTRAKRIFIAAPAEFATVVAKEVSLKFERTHRVNDDDIAYLLKKGDDIDKKDYVVINTSPIYFAVDSGNKLFSDVRGIEAKSVEACISYMLAKRSYTTMMDKVAGYFGIEDIRYVLTDWAEAVGLLDIDQRDALFALIDVGYISSSISIVKGDGIVDMRSFSMGGGHIAGDIYEYLNVPFDMAEDAKRLVDVTMKYGEDEVIVSDGENVIYALDAQEIAKNRLKMLVSIVNDTIKDINPLSTLPIYLTGEGIAPMRGVKKYLSDSLIRYVDILVPRMQGYARPEDSSKAALIIMAQRLAEEGRAGGFIKRLFNGGKHI